MSNASEKLIHPSDVEIDTAENGAQSKDGAWMKANSSEDDGATPEQENTQKATEAQQHSHLTYRADIDGLRAIAVLPVVIFHAYPESIPGGFTGVDIFFVISGFLISGILFKQAANGTFTYGDFYARRIRRIFPTLWFVLLVTLCLGCAYLAINALKSMAATMLAGSLFAANMQLLFLRVGYFDADSKLNPLLHLWSLGVEEQFYIVWPLCITLISRLSFRKAILAQSILLVLSFVANILFLDFKGSNKYSFYLLPCRFWEMSMGGLLVYVVLHPSYKARVHTGFLPDILSVAGIAMITVGFACLKESDTFPGFWALLPTLGASSLILAGPDTTLFHRWVMCNPLMVYIGKISYPLYLWHWPLLVFGNVIYPLDRPWYVQPYAMLVYAFLASVVSYEVIENKLRRRQAKWVVPMLTIGMLCIVIMSAVVYTNPGTFSVVSKRLNDLLASGSAGGTECGGAIPPDLNMTSTDTFSTVVLNSAEGPMTGALSAASAARAALDGDWFDQWQNIPEDSPYITLAATKYPSECNPDPGNIEYRKVLNAGKEQTDGLVVILGDSHVMMTLPRFTRLWEYTQSNNLRFPTIVSKTVYGRAALPCNGQFMADLDMIKQVKPQAVYISMRWHRGYLQAINLKNRLDAFAKAIEDLRGLGIQVFVATQNVEGDNFDPKNMLVGGKLGPVPAATSYVNFRGKFLNGDLFPAIQASVESGKATLIDFADNMCDSEGQCQVVDRQGEPIYTDDNHFRNYFSRNYASVLDQIVISGLKKMEV